MGKPTNLQIQELSRKVASACNLLYDAKEIVQQVLDDDGVFLAGDYIEQDVLNVYNDLYDLTNDLQVAEACMVESDT